MDGLVTSPGSQETSSNHKQSSLGIILGCSIGISVGVIALAVGIWLVVYYCQKRRRNKEPDLESVTSSFDDNDQSSTNYQEEKSPKSNVTPLGNHFEGFDSGYHMEPPTGSVYSSSHSDEPPPDQTGHTRKVSDHPPVPPKPLQATTSMPKIVTTSPLATDGDSLDSQAMTVKSPTKKRKPSVPKILLKSPITRKKKPSISDPKRLDDYYAETAAANANQADSPEIDLKMDTLEVHRSGNYTQQQPLGLNSFRSLDMRDPRDAPLPPGMVNMNTRKPSTSSSRYSSAMNSARTSANFSRLSVPYTHNTQSASSQHSNVVEMIESGQTTPYINSPPLSQETSQFASEQEFDFSNAPAKSGDEDHVIQELSVKCLDESNSQGHASDLEMAHSDVLESVAEDDGENFNMDMSPVLPSPLNLPDTQTNEASEASEASQVSETSEASQASEACVPTEVSQVSQVSQTPTSESSVSTIQEPAPTSPAPPTPPARSKDRTASLTQAAINRTPKKIAPDPANESTNNTPYKTPMTTPSRSGVNYLPESPVYPLRLPPKSPTKLSSSSVSPLSSPSSDHPQLGADHQDSTSYIDLPNLGDFSQVYKVLDQFDESENEPRLSTVLSFNRSKPATNSPPHSPTHSVPTNPPTTHTVTSPPEEPLEPLEPKEPKEPKEPLEPLEPLEPTPQTPSNLDEYKYLTYM